MSSCLLRSHSEPDGSASAILSLDCPLKGLSTTVQFLDASLIKPIHAKLVTVTKSSNAVDPVQEHRLRCWIAGVLAREGYSLKRTRQGSAEYAQCGRWSRWYYDKLQNKSLLVEANVDLDDLAGRCHAYLNARAYRN